MGQRFGSLVNHVNAMANVGVPQPVIGMPATVLGWSDRYPATVIEVENNGKRVTVQEDNYKRIDDNGMTDSGQEYEYTPNPNGNKSVFMKDRRGRWQSATYNEQTKRWNMEKGGDGLHLGSRERYYDFSF